VEEADGILDLMLQPNLMTYESREDGKKKKDDDEDEDDD